jgi:dodecin
MSESVYKVIELVGTSSESWEQAAKLAMMTAAKNLRDIRVAEVVAMDIHVEDEQIVFRTKMKISFKYHDDA